MIDTVESVAANTGFEPRVRAGVYVRLRRQRRVKAGVEYGDLRKLGPEVARQYIHGL